MYKTIMANCILSGESMTQLLQLVIYNHTKTHCTLIENTVIMQILYAPIYYTKPYFTPRDQETSFIFPSYRYDM